MKSRHIHVSVAGLLLLSAVQPAAAQNPTGGAERKQAVVAQVPEGAIRVDGRLDEEAWLRATPVTDFVQKEPIEGAAPTDVMEVRFVYDDGALYVGARMSTRNNARDSGAARPTRQHRAGRELPGFVSTRFSTVARR